MKVFWSPPSAWMLSFVTRKGGWTKPLGVLAVERAVQFVDRLIGLQLDRLGHRDHLVLVALADAVIGRAVAVGRDELDLARIDAAERSTGTAKSQSLSPTEVA